MTNRDQESVPRGDHVPGGHDQQNEQKERQQEERVEAGTDSAAHRGHGAHGRGVLGREEHVDPADPKPDFAKGTDRGGSAGWGSEKSGGSVIDKR